MLVTIKSIKEVRASLQGIYITCVYKEKAGRDFIDAVIYQLQTKAPAVSLVLF